MDQARAARLFSRLSPWIAAGVVFYSFIYMPSEKRKQEQREKAVVVIDKEAKVGKYRRDNRLTKANHVRSTIIAQSANPSQKAFPFS
ncbi:hypothetical protein BWQ96_10123 [Gracilariopsis chorda]|uniref:Uncharacterized protein n=1 Tax=Gracilariopsis chorda TaxID=448386 RepID=A0A2V3IDJ3_9FLOR|nr:hypothetical protein BWQ96_10123 [Gracilariopsis chorda]|eukprot:PXF40155.1 hypothetical protein BWQ96_10123 [Gracilariopsis chorda]